MKSLSLGCFILFMYHVFFIFTPTPSKEYSSLPKKRVQPIFIVREKAPLMLSLSKIKEEVSSVKIEEEVRSERPLLKAKKRNPKKKKQICSFYSHSKYLVAVLSVHRIYKCKGNNLIGSYPTAFGLKSESELEKGVVKDKERQGDHRTPFGSFKIIDARPVSHSDYGGIWIKLDTTKKSRKAYLSQHENILYEWEGDDGLIETDKEVQDFNRWAKKMGHPLMFRGIGIHGGGWRGTRGCLASSNKDIRSIYRWVEIGMIIHISS